MYKVIELKGGEITNYQGNIVSVLRNFYCLREWHLTCLVEEKDTLSLNAETEMLNEKAENDPVDDAMQYAEEASKIKPFLYSERNKLANLFKKWAKDNDAAICPTNLITWLSSNTLLDMNKVFELLEKEKK